jgi:hypothetical protein
MFGGGSKVRTKRVEPPQRKLANSLLSIEAVRGLSGIQGPGDILEQQRMRSQALQDVDLQNREALRAMGERGMESPGRYEAMSAMREGALGNLIQARNAAIASKRAGATSILSNLLAENQPYQKTRVKQSSMSKAAPYMSMGGKVVGGVIGGIYGGPMGAQMGSQIGGSAMDAVSGGENQAPKMGASSTVTPGSGAGASTPQPAPGSPYGSPTAQAAGETAPTEPMPGSPFASPSAQSAGQPSKFKKGMMGGLEGLTSLFGGK